MRIKLVVAYDGTDFCGWAPQPGRRTVQSTLTEAVRYVSSEEIEIFGASRTDSGAHAKAQVCHFDSLKAIPPDRWPLILNRQLPADIAVLSSRPAPHSFHSRFCAKDRFYRYRISVGPEDPFRSRFVHRFGRPLNADRMQLAANYLLGDHDFRAFTEELDSSVLNTRRKLFGVKCRRVRDEVWVDVVGTAFLRGMMRRIAGALLEVGCERRPVEEVGKLLTREGQERIQWPVVLPASGLCLMRVRYDRILKDIRTASLGEINK
jgi:tRNA pseudouridine38-40 synthase